MKIVDHWQTVTSVDSEDCLKCLVDSNKHKRLTHLITLKAAENNRVWGNTEHDTCQVWGNTHREACWPKISCDPTSAPWRQGMHKQLWRHFSIQLPVPLISPEKFYINLAFFIIDTSLDIQLLVGHLRGFLNDERWMNILVTFRPKRRNVRCFIVAFTVSWCRYHITRWPKYLATHRSDGQIDLSNGSTLNMLIECPQATSYLMVIIIMFAPSVTNLIYSQSTFNDINFDL